MAISSPQKGIRNGGRKKGGQNKKTKEIAEKTRDVIAKALAEGLSPVEVMIHNMRYQHDQAELILKKLLAMKTRVPEGFSEFQQLQSFRKLSQDAAKDAAPYFHAKIAPIDGQSGNTATQTVQFIIER